MLASLLDFAPRLSAVYPSRLRRSRGGGEGGREGGGKRAITQREECGACIIVTCPSRPHPRARVKIIPRGGGLGKSSLRNNAPEFSGYSRVSRCAGRPFSAILTTSESRSLQFHLAPVATYPQPREFPRERNFLLFQTLSQALARLDVGRTGQSGKYFPLE